MTRPHVIAEVRFAATALAGRPMSEAPLVCSCGWQGTSGTFDAHRGDTVDMARVKRNQAAFRERERVA